MGGFPKYYLLQKSKFSNRMFHVLQVVVLFSEKECMLYRTLLVRETQNHQCSYFIRRTHTAWRQGVREN